MAYFHDRLLALALAVTALTLSGCGSSSKGGGSSPAPPPPPAPAPAPIALASQTVKGTVGGVNRINSGKPVTIPPQPFGLYIDADNMNVRVDASGSMTIENITAQAEAKVIFSASEQRVTYFVNASVPKKKFLRCSYVDVSKWIKSVNASRDLINEILGLIPVTKAADGNKQMSLDKQPFDWKNGTTHVKGTASATVEFSEGNVLAKVSSDVEVQEPTEESNQGLVNVTTMSASAPPSSKFVVDETWGNCTKKPVSALDEDLAFEPHIKLPLKMVLQKLQTAKPETEIEEQSDLIAI